MKTYLNGKNGFYAELTKYLTSKGCDLFLVQAEYQRPETNDQPADFKGIDIALEFNSNEAPILLCSFMPKNYFLKKKEFSTKFHALMGKARTGFIDTISEPEVFYNKYLELIDSKKEEDILAVELNRAKEYEKVMSFIQHSVLGRIPDCKDQRAFEHINKARGIGVTGTDEEVFKTILDFKWDSKDAKFVGKYFPGVFCDLEGTLFIGNEINPKLLNELEKISSTKPITLWTAGDIEEYQKKLISKGILWKLVSKTDFFGAEVEIAYDDLSYENFHSKFGVKVRKFNQVNGIFNEELKLRLEFLHFLLLPSGVPDVLINPKFSSILNMLIELKEIRDYVMKMENEKDEDQYNQKLIVIRDFLIN